MFDEAGESLAGGSFKEGIDDGACEFGRLDVGLDDESAGLFGGVGQARGRIDGGRRTDNNHGVALARQGVGLEQRIGWYHFAEHDDGCAWPNLESNA